MTDQTKPTHTSKGEESTDPTAPAPRKGLPTVELLLALGFRVIPPRGRGYGLPLRGPAPERDVESDG